MRTPLFRPFRPARLLLPVTTTTVLALTAGLLPAQALEPSPGSSGSGDSVIPQRGNGGYDVARYDIDLLYRPQRKRIAATTTVTATATQDLSSFNLELEGLEVRAVGARIPASPPPVARWPFGQVAVADAAPCFGTETVSVATAAEAAPALMSSSR